MLVTNKEALEDAARNGYAIPAINTQGGNYDIIWAICRAAEEMRSPIILAHYVSTGEYAGNDWFVEVAKWCANKVSVPVSIHLDHGDSFEICKEALDLGFTSVMIDGSSRSTEENAELTDRVVQEARKYGVMVEAEIGELVRLDGDGAVAENKNVADPEEVRKFLSLCQPDSLAIGIGNAHGYYKGKPDIRLDILKKVREFTDIPLVLHGCTGMSEDTIKEAIGLGVAKINFGTEIRYKYVEHYEEGLKELNHQGHSWKLSQFANEKLSEDVKAIIRLAGSEGKAVKSEAAMEAVQ
ncbi:class II fructose-bisphosphate aldolase [Anaerobium acetethylicum]|uniref:Fructose-bisphosphate aldolase, class II n=1 Tax=Anaerobium acetethylicum TaxID=1619234 RepID=A0A1D3TUC9_9FIRM|nr:class II fructose-bisphosphate aldolase [Anaerobium acetethylicum]SCP97637.1 fructose-bisphosphate aldolase, class II [Anaerobium acetethylicum]